MPPCCALLFITHNNLGLHVKILNLDFETRSTCDLKVGGSYVYARDPSTSVLCAAYSIDDAPEAYWATAAGLPMPSDLTHALCDDKVEVHAWNAQFERNITRYVLKLHVADSRYRCTAAHARARCVPGKLESALDFLGMARSLAEKRYGTAIMLKWCKPLPTGGWANDPQEYMDLIRYCLEDVKSEKAIARRLSMMTPREQHDYLVSEMINHRGLPIDRALAQAAMTYGKQEKDELNEELSDLTGGYITSTSQHARVKEVLSDKLPPEVFAQFFITKKKNKKTDEMEDKVSADKRARADFLNSEAAREVDQRVVDMLQIVDDAGKASVSKFAAMYGRSADNGRAEGSYLYAGAAQTKRYSSVGLQAHNFPRKSPEDVEAVAKAILAHEVQGKVMHVLSSMLRPTIKAPPGRKLVWGDWKSVEARGMPWLADCQWKLDLYRAGKDVYKVNAGDIFGVPLEEVTDDQRQVGKVAELSLQFGGARGALKAMARGYGLSFTDDEADRVVDAWRSANTWAMTFSKGLMRAFINACVGIPTDHGKVIYMRIPALIEGTTSLAAHLPDGTVLYYHGIEGTLVFSSGREVELEPGTTFDRAAWNLYDTKLRYRKPLAAGHRIERIWHGLLAENATQALCAALLRDCLGRVDQRVSRIDAAVVGHTHDEVICEAADNCVLRTEEALQAEMEVVPEWLLGFPLGADVGSGPRYAK